MIEGVVVGWRTPFNFIAENVKPAVMLAPLHVRFQISNGYSAKKRQ